MKFKQEKWLYINFFQFFIYSFYKKCYKKNIILYFFVIQISQFNNILKNLRNLRIVVLKKFINLK